MQPGYIGLHDQANEGTFQWVTTELVSYTNWFPGEPNNYPYSGEGQEDCTHMYSTGQWNDTVCNIASADSYVIEYDGPFSDTDGDGTVDDLDIDDDGDGVNDDEDAFPKDPDRHAHPDEEDPGTPDDEDEARVGDTGAERDEVDSGRVVGDLAIENTLANTGVSLPVLMAVALNLLVVGMLLHAVGRRHKRLSRAEQ